MDSCLNMFAGSVFNLYLFADPISTFICNTLIGSPNKNKKKANKHLALIELSLDTFTNIDVQTNKHIDFPHAYYVSDTVSYEPAANLFMQSHLSTQQEQIQCYYSMVTHYFVLNSNKIILVFRQIGVSTVHMHIKFPTLSPTNQLKTFIIQSHLSTEQIQY